MFNSLSEKQKKIVFIDSDRVVIKACPGSGKTFVVAARLANKILKWKEKYIGIATLSFTNTAWQEIEKNLVKFDNTSIKYPHFLGTIDSFINHYIFLPFGHLVMGCNRRPVLVGEPHEKWHGRNIGEKYFDRSSFNIDGNFIFTQNYPAPPSNAGALFAIKRTKNSLLKRGYANQHDANYFALKIIKEYPQIVKSLVGRFPILLIDEAQDTTEIQMAIIDELSRAGLKEIFMVGDPDQAIFEWNNANPELFIKKCNEWNLGQLDECRRSSQNICNFVYKLSTLPNPASAVSLDVSSSMVQPEIIEYDDLSNIKEYFLDKCSYFNIPLDKKSVSILCRKKKIVNNINGLFDNTLPVSTEDYFDIWRDGFSWCKNICEGLYLIEKGDYKIGHKIFEKGCFEVLTKLNYSREGIKKLIEKNGLVKWRKFMYSIIKESPSTSERISNWLLSFSSVSRRKFKIDNIDAIKKGRGNLLIKDIFGSSINCEPSNLPIRVGTIHSAKGETFEATLVILDSNGGRKKYKTMMSECEKNNLLQEELRTVYVAITRPKQFLVLGVPSGDGSAWSEFLIN